MRSTIKDTQEIITHHLHGLWKDKSLAKIIPPLLISGPPGIGKSQIIREICDKEGIGFIDIRLSQREPVDLRGLPVPDGEMVKWLLSSEYPRDKDSKGIIFFDELTAADRSLQVAAYELILDRRLGDLYSLPDGWYICAAGNRSGDRAISTTMSSALANRFCHIEMEADLTSWIPWANKTGIHPLVLGFLKYKSSCFFDMSGDVQRGWASPRSWERVSTELHLSDSNKIEGRTLNIIIQGLVGKGAGVEFSAFCSWAGKIPDVLAMMRGKKKIVIPERADQKYALTTTMVYNIWRHEDTDKLVEGFIKISTELSSDFAAMAMLEVLFTDDDDNLTSDRAEKIYSHPAYPKWTEKHGTALRNGMR